MPSLFCFIEAWDIYTYKFKCIFIYIKKNQIIWKKVLECIQILNFIDLNIFAYLLMPSRIKTIFYKQNRAKIIKQ